MRGGISISCSLITRIVHPIHTKFKKHSAPHQYFVKLLSVHYPSKSMDTSEILEKPAKLAVKIFQDAVESVKPKNLLAQKLKLEGTVLKISSGSGSTVALDLQQHKSVNVIGFGKAVLPMAEQMKAILGERIGKCIVSIPEGFRDTLVPGIEIFRGAKNNIPDEGAALATKKIVHLVQHCEPDDLLITLITGGGSSNLTYPLPPITITELGSFVKLLSRAGASIQELNTVRKRLSLVKGGGLLNFCRSTKIISLILSDVLGDPLETIASGPTVRNPDPEPLAKEIIKKYMKLEELPPGIKEALKNPVTHPPPKDVSNIIIGNNSIALQTAANTAKNLNLYPMVWTETLEGEASVVGRILGHVTQALSYLFRTSSEVDRDAYIEAVLNSADELKLNKNLVLDTIELLKDHNLYLKYDGICVLLGGETTVKVQGTGTGGRNQELVLSTALNLDPCVNVDYVKGKVALLSAGTDGFDGPCDAAGAVTDSKTLENGVKSNLSASVYLKNNDSYNYFQQNSKGAYHIITGHTETNVMDLIVIVVVK